MYHNSFRRFPNQVKKARDCVLIDNEGKIYVHCVYTFEKNGGMKWLEEEFPQSPKKDLKRLYWEALVCPFCGKPSVYVYGLEKHSTLSCVHLCWRERLTGRRYTIYEGNHVRVLDVELVPKGISPCIERFKVGLGI